MPTTGAPRHVVEHLCLFLFVVFESVEGKGGEQAQNKHWAVSV